MSAYSPLKITASLECGVIADRFLPIDSILYSQLMRETFGPQDFTLPGQHVDSAAVARARLDMPLKMIRTQQLRKERLWYYAASFADWSEPTGEGVDHWVKKFDSRMIELLEAKKMSRLNIASGRYRGYRMPVFYRIAPEISWYVVGDIERVRILLSTVTHIGKKTAQGWGAISRWTVEPHTEDWSCWRDGEPMRAIPAESGPTYGIRPSYWNPVNQCPCVLPATS